MRPCTTAPLIIRGSEFGGPRPLFCVPLVAADLDQLLLQAGAARSLSPDIIEWRVDSYEDLSAESVGEAMRALRSVLLQEPIIFTLRIKEEGGAKQLAPEVRSCVIRSALYSGLIDIVDVELRNGPQFNAPVMSAAREHGTKVILSFHDFETTPSNETLLQKISEMARQGADIAKTACMPREPGDVLRLLQVTLTARGMFPNLPLITMSMGRLGMISRVAGFLYGCDMSFAVGKEISAPGQIPIGEARAMTDAVLRHA